MGGSTRVETHRDRHVACNGLNSRRPVVVGAAVPTVVHADPAGRVVDAFADQRTEWCQRRGAESTACVIGSSPTAVPRGDVIEPAGV